MLVKENRLLSVSNSEIINGTIIIPENIEIIEDNAFVNVTNLISIDISKSIKAIGKGAFMGCLNLRSINISSNVTEIGKECFSKCKSLEFATIDANMVKLPNKIFEDCINLKEVKLSNSIKTLGEASFNGCKSLSLINLPNNLLLIDKGCFYNCVNLIHIDLPASINFLESSCFSKSGLVTFDIPKQVTKLPFGVFQDCRSLKQVKFHGQFKALGDNVFNGCISLKEINLPNSLESMGALCFSNCVKLMKIVLPQKIHTINTYTFSNCKNLQNIEMLGIIKEISSYAFDSCKSLSSINLGEVISIGNHAFKDCESLTKLLLPSSIKEIFENVLDGCLNLKEISFPSSLTNATDIIQNIFIQNNDVKVFIYDRYYQYQELLNIKNIRNNEILDRIYKILTKNRHIYNLDKENIYKMYEENSMFKDVVDSMVFNSRQSNSSYEKELIKFDNLFPRTRFSNLPNGTIFNSLNNDLILKYNVKMMRKIKCFDIFNSPNLECEHLIPNVISFFGLFENDNRCYYRLELLKKVLFYNYAFNSRQYLSMPSNIKQYFTKVDEKCFLLDDKVNIPSDFRDYLKRIMNSEDVKNIKSLKNRFGKKINDFFKNHYSVANTDMYILKDSLLDENIKSVNSYILSSTLENQITYNNLNEIFKDLYIEYDENILNFFLKNIKIIISKKDYRINFKEVISRYYEIKHYYLEMGNDDFSYHDAYRYLCESIFFNVNKGNYEFEQMVKKAGITSQSKFDEYQELYEGMKNQKISMIPRIKESININIDDTNYIVIGEILRRDDPFALLVGESSYTNCCQTLNDNGYDCLIHSINEGRIFCTYLINQNQKILLAQSWVWRNGNVICFDNIEGTNYMNKDILYSKLVANAYQYISSKIIEMAHKYKDKIDVIMVGSNHNDLKKINYYFGPEYENTICPKGYYSYVDSSKVHYIIGNKEQIDTSFNPKKIYIDERIFVHETGINITTKTIQKLGIINHRYGNINFAFELSEFFGISLNDISIIYGEDWYILYKWIDNSLNILDSGMLELDTKKELRMQETEILKAYKLLIKAYNVSPDIISSVKNKEKEL